MTLISLLAVWTSCLNFQFPSGVVISSHCSCLTSTLLEDDLGPFLDDHKILQLQIAPYSADSCSCNPWAILSTFYSQLNCIDLIRETLQSAPHLGQFQAATLTGGSFSKIKLMPKIAAGGYNSYTSKLLKANFELNVRFPIQQSSHPACTVDTSKLDLQRDLPLTLQNSLWHNSSLKVVVLNEWLTT